MGPNEVDQDNEVLNTHCAPYCCSRRSSNAINHLFRRNEQLFGYSEQCLTAYGLLNNSGKILSLIGKFIILYSHMLL